MANTPQCIYNIPCNMEIRYISSLFETWSFLSLVASYSQKKKKKEVWWQVYFYYSLNLVSEITILNFSLTPIQIYLHKSMICQFSFIFFFFLDRISFLFSSLKEYTYVNNTVILLVEKNYDFKPQVRPSANT